MRRRRIRSRAVAFTVEADVCALLSVAPATAAAQTLLSDNMSSYPLGTCYAERQTFGNFQDIFNGYGTTCVSPIGSGRRAAHALTLEPEASTSPTVAHANLATTIASFNSGAGYTLNVTHLTTRQLRTGSSPNPWEVGWVLWNYADNDHFYNVILKPNGWEVDKEYLAGGIQAQQFLATRSRPVFPVGTVYQVRVVQTVSNGVPTFAVSAGGAGGSLQSLVTVTDPGASASGRAYTSGKVGLYAEDSAAQYQSVMVTSP